MKTLFNLGEVPSKRADSVKAWFYGKLFLAILVETIIKRESFFPGERSNPAYNDKFMEKFADSFDIINLLLSELDFQKLKIGWSRLLSEVRESKRKRIYALFRLFSC